uniref:Uncharacterized protein n=1 Tax=Anolis carolinensis TaxID=28377 RepID=A0A803TEA2_ANOCA
MSLAAWPGLEGLFSMQNGWEQSLPCPKRLLVCPFPCFSPLQLSERMALMVESLERLRSRMQPPSAAVRGDPAWIQEQLRENGLCLAELEKLGVALETLRGQGAELLATVQTSANEGMDKIQGRVEQLLHQWEEMWAQGEERERWLQSLLALAERFWHGLSDLTTALGDTQQAVMEPVEASSDPAAIRTRLEAMQVLDSPPGALGSLWSEQPL